MFGCPGSKDDTITINYYLLYAKYFIYLKKLKEQTNPKLTSVPTGRISLRIEKRISIMNNQPQKFDKFNNTYDNM